MQGETPGLQCNPVLCRKPTRKPEDHSLSVLSFEPVELLPLALFDLACQCRPIAPPDSMRRRAEIEDEGRYTVLGFGTVAASAVLLAIVFELHGSKNADSPGLHIALAATTILLSWFFDICTALRPWLLW